MIRGFVRATKPPIRADRPGVTCVAETGDAIVDDTGQRVGPLRDGWPMLAGRRRPCGAAWPVPPTGAYGWPVLLADRFRPTPRQYVRISQLALAGLALIIVTGASVRLTGSGLGCTDWPLCEQGEPVAPLEFHPMVEFVNRLITGLVSAAVILAVLGSMRRTPRRADLTRWSWVLVAGVVVQIVIGAFVTLSELKYSVVAVHFLVSMALVWAAVVLVHKARDAAADDAMLDGGAQPPPRAWSRAAKLLVALATGVLVSGAMVTSAGKHPGALVDHNGEELVVERLPFDIGSLARVHSLLVWGLCAVTVVCAVRAQRGAAPGGRTAYELLIVVVAQGALGYVQYFSGVPALMVAFHVAGATLVWVMALRVAFATAEAPADGLVRITSATDPGAVAS